MNNYITLNINDTIFSVSIATPMISFLIMKLKTTLYNREENFNDNLCKFITVYCWNQIELKRGARTKH